MSKLRVMARLGRGFAADEAFVGPGALGVAGAVGAARMAVVASPSLLAGGYLQKTLARAARRTVITLIEAPRGEPVLDQLGPVIAELAEFRPDWILAAGGGAVLDTGKLCWALYEHPDLSDEVLRRPFALPPLGSKAKFIAAPTTNGSGSEASSTATFQFTAGERKSFLVSHELVPNVALLDPELARNLPSAVIATSGLDALAHAMEGYTSAYAGALSDIQSIGAASGLFRSLARAVAVPDDMLARTEVMAAAYHAGAVQNLSVPGVGHAVAHQLAAHGIGHAHATGVMLGPALLFNSRTSQKPVALANSLGFRTVDELAKRLTNLRDEIAAPKIDPVVLARLAGDDVFLDGVLSDPCARANPSRLDRAAVAEVLALAAS
jgi:alcohol dehydrogenase